VKLKTLIFFFSCLQAVFSARIITTCPGVTSSMRFGSRTIGRNLGRSRALYDAVLLSHFMAFLLCSSNYNRLVSVTCKSRVFRKLFKTPFHVSLVCMQIPECYFVQGTCASCVVATPAMYLSLNIACVEVWRTWRSPSLAYYSVAKNTL
jgi:hypothetical protein